MLLRVEELMRRRPTPTLSFSKRLSSERQPESKLCRACPEMVTSCVVSCLRRGNIRHGAAKSEMVTLYMLSCLRCGKFRDWAGSLGK